MRFDVLLLIPTLNIGGTENQILRIAEQCKQSDIAATIVASRSGPLKPKILSKNLNLMEISKHSSNRRTFGNAFSTIATVISLKPKVLDCFLPESVVYGLFVKLILGKKVFFVINRRSDLVYRKRLSIFSVLDRVANRFADAVTVNSRTLLGVYSKSDKIQFNKLYLTENILPRSRDDLDFNRTSNPIKIITVANFTNLKGLHFLLEAYAKLAVNGFHFEAKLVGSGPLTEHIYNYLTYHHLECVSVHTEVSDPEKLLRGSDVFVLPSLTEGSSNALAEAMCFGLACIATDVGGNADLIQDCGILIAPKSSDAIYTALARFLTNPDLILNYRKQSKARYDILNQKRKLENVRFKIYQSAFDRLE